MKVNFSKETDFLLVQSVDTLKNKLSEIEKGSTQSYNFEYMYEVAIKHCIKSMCYELQNFTNALNPWKTAEIISYRKKWVNNEWNLNTQNRTILNEEEKATKKIIKYIQQLKQEYVKRDNRHKYAKTLGRLNMLYESFDTLIKIIDKTIQLSNETLSTETCESYVEGIKHKETQTFQNFNDLEEHLKN